MVLGDVACNLCRLVVNGGKVRIGAESESIDLGSNDVVVPFEEPNKRHKNLIRHPQAG